MAESKAEDPVRGSMASPEDGPLGSEDQNDVKGWIKAKLGLLPRSSLGWFRAGVGFYNKRQHSFAIQCFERAVALDPHNYNAYQIMARALIAVNRRDDAIDALKESVKLNNPSDWQLLVELTGAKPSTPLT
eukprot:CAMPEP_0184511652 /NCGR_PEP_ID=MMETSP0198_2-20121128/2463_1 /TAXON_ID=1112570 /ORGANISM="Thraustochytrium sp., Strain LLF1b" /LENGTH=130 /DNA_ID=CAMNT_0026901627 /DNA_START=32 /DNA_END=424 /DNA_ORIENTATION=+